MTHEEDEWLRNHIHEQMNKHREEMKKIKRKSQIKKISVGLFCLFLLILKQKKTNE